MNLDKETQQIIDDWLTCLKIKNLSPNTIKNYKSEIRKFMRFLNLHRGRVTKIILADINIRDLRTWLLAQDEYNRSTKIRSVNAIRNFYKFLSRHYNIQNMAVISYRIRQKQRPLPKAISEKEAYQILDSLKKQKNWMGKRDYALAMLLYGSGLRIAEALSLRKRDLDNAEEFITVMGKGGKERQVPILPVVKKAIKRYLSACPHKIKKNDWLFVGTKGGQLHTTVFQRNLKEVGEKLEIKITPHVLRHTFATALLHRSADLPVIQKLLGHESLLSTQVYTKITDSHIMESYMKAHPRA